MVGIVRPGGSVAAQGRHDVVPAHQVGVPTDVLDGRAADLGCPFRGLLDAIVLSHEVVVEVLVERSIGGHVVGVEAHAVRVEEVPVHHRALLGFVRLQHLVGDRQQEGRVGAGADPDPFRVEVRRGCVVLGAHEDEFGAALLGLVEVVRVGSGRCHRHVHAVQHDMVGVHEVRPVVLFADADVGKAAGCRVIAGGSPGKRSRAGNPSAQCVEHLAYGRAEPRSRDDDGLVAVVLYGVGDLVGDEPDGLVPADALPFVDAAQLFLASGEGLPVRALHGVLQAVGAEGVLPMRASSRAGAQLRAGHRIGGDVVGFLPHDHAVDDVDLVLAHAAAVVVAGSGHPLPFDGGIEFPIHRRRGGFRLGLLQLVFRLAAYQRQARHGRRARSHERTPGDAAVRLLHAHAIPLFLSSQSSPFGAKALAEASRRFSPLHLSSGN